MASLLPCPFCVGEAVLIEDEPTQGFCFVECVDCGSRGSLTAKAQAITAWNTRAERTCRIMPTGIIKLETVDCYECSECHEAIQVMEGSTVHYCPNCGSRVLEES